LELDGFRIESTLVDLTALITLDVWYQLLSRSILFGLITIIIVIVIVIMFFGSDNMHIQ